jgi:hypothetical protein
MRKLLGVLIVMFFATGFISAQSLKPDNPYPLKAGINQGTSDSLVGTHYWYFYTAPGNSRISVRMKTPTTLYGTELKNNALTVTISDEKRTWRSTKVITSNKNSSEATFTADKVEKKMKIIVSVAPPSQNLLRMGGEYEIEATGAVQFDEVKSAADPIVRTYDSKVNSYGAIKFLANGTVEASDGSQGTWKVFDRESNIYIITIDKFRFSVQYQPGYGLVETGNGLIAFQELKR